MSLTQVSGDIFIHYIAKKYLSPIQIYSLRQTCPYFSKLLKNIKKFKDVVESRLREFVPIAPKFMRALLKHKHYIGGSFIAACLLEEDYKGMDLDCYVCFPDKETMHQACGAYSHTTQFIYEVYHLR
jgi:hypothetical protein